MSFSVSSKETERLLQVSFLPGVGAASLRRIAEHASQHGISSLSNDEEILLRFAFRGGKAGKQSLNGYDTVLNSCYTHGIRIISYLDSQYPPALIHIEDYPPLIYVRGDLAPLSKISCAVVGTRDASRLGTSWARQISEIFVAEGFSIVSGLALGIDTAAHEGALRSKGKTVAILAHGLDKVTPASNRDLADEIIEKGGALVSEHPPGVPPRRQEYVRRNRIQSGMSICSVVVESGESGGAIHQGKFTKEQGRRLYCVVPNDTTNGYSEFQIEGAKRLIREVNAVPVSNSADLISELKSGALQRDFKLLHKTGSAQPELF